MRYAISFVLFTALPIAAFQNASSKSLQVGIERNQKTIQELAAMIEENEKEETQILVDASLDATSLLSAGVISSSNAAYTREFIQSVRAGTELDPSSYLYTTKVAEALGQLADRTGNANDIFNTIADFNSNDAWTNISNYLKLAVNTVSANPALAEVGIASNVSDLGIKAAQWWSLDATNTQLEQVLASLEAAQEKLLAKDPVTQARLLKAAESVARAAQQRQQSSADLLRKYYKDHPDQAMKVNTPQIIDARQQSGNEITKLNLCSIPGINPAACAAWKNCNQIAQTMVARQQQLMAIMNSCPKPSQPGGLPPPCPAYEAAAQENAAIDYSAMTCNKDANGQYIPFFSSGSSRASSMQSPDSKTDDVDCMDKRKACVKACPVVDGWPTRACQNSCQTDSHYCCEAHSRAVANGLKSTWSCDVALP